MPSKCILLLLVGAACDAGGGREGDLADLPRLELAEEIRIGSVADPDVGFSEIGGVAVDDDGRVYVLERQEREVRVYDPAGTLVQTIGRPGSGPGEFQSEPLSLGVWGDTLWVIDRRLTLFTRSGELLRTFAPKPTILQLGPGVMAMLYAGRFARDGTITSQRSIAVPAGDNEPAPVRVMIPMVKLDTTGAVLDTIDYEPLVMGTAKRTTVGEHAVWAPAPPDSEPMRFHADGEVWVVERPLAASDESGELRITRIGASGDTVFDRVLHYEPQPFSDLVVDSMIARAAARYARQDWYDDAAIRAAMRTVLALPPFQPPISAGFLAHDGVLWLRRADEGTANASWILIAADGEPIGSIDLPRRATLHWASGATVWAAVPDDVDVPWLVRYGIGSDRL